MMMVISYHYKCETVVKQTCKKDGNNAADCCELFERCFDEENDTNVTPVCDYTGHKPVVCTYSHFS